METIRTLIVSILETAGHSNIGETTRGYGDTLAQLEWKQVSPFFTILLNVVLIALISLIVRSKYD
jgi:hypothetical protein